MACGLNDKGQCDIPPLAEGLSYTQVAAGLIVIQYFCEVMAALSAAVKMTVVNATFHIWHPVRATFGIACQSVETGKCS